MIATFMKGRTGSQVKNQFFNIVRTLMRKAFKHCFKKSEGVAVSDIKPKVLSEIVNKQLIFFNQAWNPNGSTNVKHFLIDFVARKLWCDESQFQEAREILQTIKDYMWNRK